MLPGSSSAGERITRRLTSPVADLANIAVLILDNSYPTTILWNRPPGRNLESSSSILEARGM